MKIYMTRRNDDMIEGRGPMVYDKLFLHRRDAENYIDEQPGIMGRRPGSGRWSTEKCGGDWDIVEVEVHESLASMREFDSNRSNRIRLKALSKLTEEEQKILGLK